MTFRVGQKVACIDADGADDLSHGAIYTIKEILPVSKRVWRGSWCTYAPILLVEAKPNSGTVAFCPERFRPVVERETDITIFTEILRNASKPARGPAVALQDRG
jgi:hypothetical protein